jgi:hypothetical protein
VSTLEEKDMRRSLLIFTALVIAFAGAVAWRRSGEASSGPRVNSLPAVLTPGIPVTIGIVERRDVLFEE